MTLHHLCVSASVFLLIYVVIYAGEQVFCLIPWYLFSAIIIIFNSAFVIIHFCGVFFFTFVNLDGLST